jgi:hypothetical protein
MTLTHDLEKELTDVDGAAEAVLESDGLLAVCGAFLQQFDLCR